MKNKLKFLKVFLWLKIKELFIIIICTQTFVALCNLLYILGQKTLYFKMNYPAFRMALKPIYTYQLGLGLVVLAICMVTLTILIYPPYQHYKDSYYCNNKIDLIKCYLIFYVSIIGFIFIPYFLGKLVNKIHEFYKEPSIDLWAVGFITLLIIGTGVGLFFLIKYWVEKNIEKTKEILKKKKVKRSKL